MSDLLGMLRAEMSDQETLRVITLADKAMDKIESQAAEIERLQARVAELEDKLRHSDRKEIEACYRAMGKKEARIEELEAVLQEIAGWDGNGVHPITVASNALKEVIENE